MATAVQTLTQAGKEAASILVTAPDPAHVAAGAALASAVAAVEREMDGEKPRRKRGRPKGSKTKPKAESTPQQPPTAKLVGPPPATSSLP